MKKKQGNETRKNETHEKWDIKKGRARGMQEKEKRKRSEKETEKSFTT